MHVTWFRSDDLTSRCRRLLLLLSATRTGDPSPTTTSSHSHLDSAAQCIDDLDRLWRNTSCTRCCFFLAPELRFCCFAVEGPSLSCYSILDSYARFFAQETSVCFGFPGSSGSGSPRPLTPGDAQDFQLHWPGQAWLGENDALDGLRHEQTSASAPRHQHCPARREAIRSRHLDES